MGLADTSEEQHNADGSLLSEHNLVLTRFDGSIATAVAILEKLVRIALEYKKKNIKKPFDLIFQKLFSRLLDKFELLFRIAFQTNWNFLFSACSEVVQNSRKPR